MSRAGRASDPSNSNACAASKRMLPASGEPVGRSPSHRSMSDATGSLLSPVIRARANAAHTRTDLLSSFRSFFTAGTASFASRPIPPSARAAPDRS